MALNFSEPAKQLDLSPRITVFGVGGAGGNAVNNMIDQKLEGVEFVVANTDAQALAQNRAAGRIQMGVKITEGLGAGARPSVGSAAAEETIEEIIDHLAGAHMCFITAGMGGGTGTGAAPIIAQAARELGVLTVGVVTKPFQFEGNKRMRQAEEGIAALQKVVDTLIIIPNQNLFRLANERTTFTEAFAMADDVLYQGVKGVTDLMVRPGLINLDFADVRSVMDEMGKAMMGTGEAEGEDRAIHAAEKAIANPLLDEISLHGARGVLINITGGYDLTLFELDEAANRIREKVDPDANIIVGSTLDPSMDGVLRVSVVATGIDVEEKAAMPELPRRSFSEPVRPTLADRPALRPAPEPVRTAEPQPVAARQAAPGPDQPTLFGRPEQRATTDADAIRYEHGSAHQQPAYVASAPQQAQPEPEPLFVSQAPGARAAQAPQSAGEYMPPRRPQPGSPSPETLERLQRAVQKAAPQQARGYQPAASPEPERSGRFGIGSLISRMSGHGHEGVAAPAQQRRIQPQMSHHEDDVAPAPSDERIEIPAFLRRQAN
ncbi:MAG: cell division protein FtsZ [Roseinatronobacter sp.]